MTFQALLHQVSQWTAPAPQLQSPELSVYIVITIGAFLGNIAMGICGFGTAIIHLTVWIAAQIAGYNAGPLDQAVITCSCAMTIGMVPLFFLAKAKDHAVKPLAISIPIFKGLAAPFGALVLKLLPARQLEGVVAVLMLFMILFMNRAKLRAWAVPRTRHSKLSQSVADLHFSDSDHHSTLKQTEDASDMSSALRVPLIQRGQADLEEQQLLQDEVHHGGGSSSSSGLGNSSVSSLSSSDADEDAILLTDAGQDCEDAVICVQDETRPLQDEATWPAEGAAVEEAGQSQQAPQQQQHTFGWLFGLGCVTGLCTGILGGATGISGPPLMLLYAYLDMSKDAVRGTNAVMSLVQDQWVGYYLFGLLHWSCMYLYLASAAAGALGMLLGHSLQKCMDQQHFKAVMSGLMAMCCTLMCCSALGWISLAAGA